MQPAKEKRASAYRGSALLSRARLASRSQVDFTPSASRRMLPIASEVKQPWRATIPTLGWCFICPRACGPPASLPVTPLRRIKPSLGQLGGARCNFFPHLVGPAELRSAQTNGRKQPMATDRPWMHRGHDCRVPLVYFTQPRGDHYCGEVSFPLDVQDSRLTWNGEIHAIFPNTTNACGF